MVQEGQNNLPQPAPTTLATNGPAVKDEPVLEPDFLEEEHDLGWRSFWSRCLTFLHEHPHWLNRVILGLIGLVMLFSLIWWLTGSEEQAVTPPAPEAPVAVDWSQRFTGSTIVTTSPQNTLPQPIQAEPLPHTNIAALVATSWQQQKVMLDLYDYDLAANLRRLTTATERRVLYQQYWQELSQTLGNSKSLLQILNQERARQMVGWQQSQEKLATAQKLLASPTATSTAALANQASHQQSQAALLADNIRQLDSWHRLLQITHQLAVQRLQGVIINESVLLAGLQVTPISDDNLTIIVGSQSTGRGLLAKQRARFGQGSLAPAPNFNQQKITISPTNLKREMVNLQSVSRGPSA